VSDELRLIREAVQSIARALKDSREDAREAFYTALDVAGSPPYPRARYTVRTVECAGCLARAAATAREPESSCAHVWGVAYAYSPGHSAGDPQRFVGTYQFCEVCGEMRKQREPFGDQPDREVSGEVADGR
jgi:hypothetical protein